MIVDHEESKSQAIGISQSRPTLIDLFKVYARYIGDDQDVDYHRRSVLIKTDKNPLEYLEESSLFSADGQKQNRATDSLNKQSRILEVKNYNALNRASFMQEINGRITCVCMKDRLLLIGTSTYNVYEISLSQDKIVSSFTMEALITCVSVSDDSSLMAASSTDGSILVKATNGAWGKKLINSRFKNDYVDSMFFINNREIIAMGSGKILRFKLMKVGILLELTFTQTIVNDTMPDKLPFKINLFQERFAKKLVVASPSELVFFRITDKSQHDEYRIDRPAVVSMSDNVIVRQSGQSSLYTIFWGRILLVVKKLAIRDAIDGSPSEGTPPHGEQSEYQLLEQVDIGFKFDVGLAFDSYGIVTFRHDGQTRIGTIGNYSNLLKMGCYYEKEEKSFNDLGWFDGKIEYFLKNLENKTIKLEDETILVVEENKFKQLKLVPTEKLIEDYVSCGEWHQAIKMAVMLFSSTPVSDNHSRDLTRDLIRIISVKYINYFMPDSKADRTDDLMAFSDCSVQDKRFSVIIKTLMMSDSCAFVFEQLQHQLKPGPFWRAVGGIVKKTSGYMLKLEYLSKHIVELDEAKIVIILELTHKSVSEKYTNDEDESIQELAQALKKKGYWTALFKLSIQFPESKAIMMFLSFLLLTATSKTEPEGSSSDQSPSMFTHEQISMICSSPSPVLSLGIHGETIKVLRLFYYMRKYVQLDELSYAKSRVAVWQQLFEWLCDDTNLKYLSMLNVNLTLEIILESTLKSEIFQNQVFLHHLQKILRGQSVINKLVEGSEVTNKRKVRTLDEFEIKAYSMKIIKELVEYLLGVLSVDNRAIYTQDIGFFGIKLLNVSLFKDIAKDTPFCLICLKSVLSDKFKNDWFFYFFKLVSHRDFERSIIDCLTKTLDSASTFNTAVLQECRQLADANNQYV